MLDLAIVKTYGFREGLGTIDNSIVQWPYEQPQPQGAELDALILLGQKLAMIKQYTAALKLHFDTIAQTRDYDNQQSCASYVSSTNLLWKDEAIAFVAWRDIVWEEAYTILAQVESGQIEPPTIADFIAQMPLIDWPEPQPE